MKARTFDELEFEAIAWIVNQTLHPIGYHFAVVSGDDAEPRWAIFGDGEELAMSNDRDPNALFRVLQSLLQEAREFHGA